MYSAKSEPILTQHFLSFSADLLKGFKQHCLPLIIEKYCKKGAVLKDLSKIFDCINHNLLIAKLNVYHAEKISLDFIHSYLPKRKQKTKIEDHFCSISTSVTCFLKHQVILPLLNMRMTRFLTPTVQACKLC